VVEVRDALRTGGGAGGCAAGRDDGQAKHLLQQVLTEYLRHYNTVRPQRSLDLRPPHPAPRLTLVKPGSLSPAVHRVDVLGGLIHKYHRAA
jgi:hypothetical protein